MATVERTSELMLEPKLVDGQWGPVWRGKPMGGIRKMRARVEQACPGLQLFTSRAWKRKFFYELFDEASEIARAEEPGVDLWFAFHPSSKDASVSVWLRGKSARVDAVLARLEKETGWSAASTFDVAELPSVGKLKKGLPEPADWAEW